MNNKFFAMSETENQENQNETPMDQTPAPVAQDAQNSDCLLYTSDAADE